MLIIDRLCNNCSHRQICKIKDEYSDLVTYINKSNIEIDDFHVTVSCKNYLASYNLLGNTKFGGN